MGKPKSSLFLSTIMCTIFAWAAPAMSQTGRRPVAQTDTTQSSPPKNDGVGEIVVTANRREESLQKAPVAITAVTSETLVARGVTDATGLSNLVPSARVSLSSTDGIIQATLRGIGNEIDYPFIYEPVATNFNDVYVPRGATGIPFFDVGRVEVLPGPQGTLYGKSAIGGVLNITNNNPKNSFGIDAIGEVGNYGGRHLTAVVNAPLSDTLAVRVAGDVNNRDAYFSNGMDTSRSRAARASLLYKPNPDVSVLLWGTYAENDYRPQSAVYVQPTVNRDPYDQPRFDPFTSLIGFATDINLTRNQPRIWHFGGKLDLKLGGVSIQYIPSYLDYKNKARSAVIGLYVLGDARIKHTTQELRLSGDVANGLSLLGSLYYYHTSDHLNSAVSPTLNYPGLAGVVGNFVSEGLSGLAQLRYEATDRIRLTVGGRYSHDTATPKDASAYANFGIVPFTYPGKKTWSHFDWKVAADADVGAHSLIYANVQTAYSPGGYQSTPGIAGAKLPKQTMLGFTAGAKNRFLDGKLQANAELFLYDYKNYEVATLSGGIPLTIPVPKSRSYGAQLDFIATPARLTRINLSVGLLNARLSQFKVGSADYSGNKLPGSPELNVFAGIQQKVELANRGSITFRADTNLNSGYYGVFTNALGLRQRSFTKTDVTLTYSNPGDAWQISAFVRNAESTATKSLMIESGWPEPYARQAVFEAPRTYGLRLHVRLGRP